MIKKAISSFRNVSWIIIWTTLHLLNANHCKLSNRWTHNYHCYTSSAAWTVGRQCGDRPVLFKEILSLPHHSMKEGIHNWVIPFHNHAIHIILYKPKCMSSDLNFQLWFLTILISKFTYHLRKKCKGSRWLWLICCIKLVVK
jgi:hypothetical protein